MTRAPHHSRPSPRDFELLEMPSLSSRFPVRFPNGVTWTNLTCECAGCQKPLPDDEVRGAVVPHGKHMVSIEAAGLCHDCRLITRYVYRLYDDLRITGPRHGKWLTWGGQPVPWHQRLLAWLRGLQ